jgi:PAS domain S-box-containing protein
MSVFKLFGKKGPSEPAHTPAHLENDIQKAQTIIQNIDDGVVMFDAQQTIQLFNPAAGRLTGWSPQDAMGLNIKSVIQLVDNKGEPVDRADNPMFLIFDSKEGIRRNDLFIMTKDNQQISAQLNVSPLFDDHEQVIAAVAVFNDISKQKAEEQQRADFISTASHEMRTPVAAIEGYLALALNDKVSTIDNRARGYLEKAHSSTQHLGKLFQDLLTSAKAEDGRLTSHPGVVEMGEFLEQLTSDLRLVAEKKGLAVEFLTGDQGNTINATHGGEKVIKPLYYTFVDPDRLREVITNLFDNAVKYTPEGKISLGLTGNDQVVQCFVRDTGPGIPADDLPHLFQKFYRVDNSATRTIGGTGLGLFICRKIIEMYNGRIWAESELGKGSSFYINLPRLSTQKAQELQAAGHGADATAAAAGAETAAPAAAPAAASTAPPAGPEKTS